MSRTPGSAGALLLLIIVTGPACKSRTEPAPVPPPRRPPAAAPAVTEAAARQLVEGWLAAQNGGDFTGYERLYAAKFDGIKRAGDRIRGMDRPTWMADRRRMLAKPIRVTAEDLAIEVLPGMARARFTQTFAVGNFKDTGPKELLLVAERDRLLIAREEMLSSRTLPSPAHQAERGPLFVVAGGVLIDDDPPAEWARGEPRLTVHDDNPDIMVATRQVDQARLPQELRSWVGRAVHALGDAPCPATVRELGLVVRVDPHFSATQRWEGILSELAGGAPGTPVPEAQQAREVWQMGRPVLVGFLDRPCEGAAWASAEPVAPVLAELQTLDERDPVGAAAMRLVSAHPLYRKLQGEFEAGGERGPWPDSVNINTVGEDRSLVVVAISRSDGCAQFNGSATFVFAQDRARKGALRLLNDPEAAPGWTLEGAADFDGDGRWELLGNRNDATGDGLLMIRWQGKRLGVAATAAPTVLDCYC